MANASRTGDTAIADQTGTTPTPAAGPAGPHPGAGGASPAIAELTSLPRSERRDALEALVVREVRTALLMTDDEELPFDVSYFDLGLTSLRITEIKQGLETLFGRGINANVLFNSPTVGRLVSYLAEDLLADVVGNGAAAGAPGSAPAAALSGSAPTGAARTGSVNASGDALVNDVLRDLYQA